MEGLWLLYQITIGELDNMQVIRLAVMISAKTNVKGMVGVDCLVNSTPDHEETFVMDTLGNRTGNQTLTDGTVNFTVQSSTNRYTSIGGNGITHDDAGNMTIRACGTSG